MRIRQVAALALAVAAAGSIAFAAPAQQKVTEGSLHAIGPKGKPLGPCPLQHTDVKASISANVAYVMVTQTFANPYEDKIEAVYTFPLGADGAVTNMTMKVGKRVIRGQIKPREEAKEIYEQAKAAGHVASLLDQERPNIFTQSVANIEPGKKVEIQISYTEPLKYEDGTFSWAFPMVVGPRYMPGSGGPSTGGDDRPAPAPAPMGVRGGGGNDEVADADRLNPPVTPKGTRAGHDISVTAFVNGGTKIQKINSRQHEVDIDWRGDDRQRAKVSLKDQKTIPNKDFVLEFSIATDEIEDGQLVTTDTRGGYFMLTLQPPKKVQPKQIVPREIFFVVDTSGSQSGFPLSISRKIMARAIGSLREKDMFNIMTFAGGTRLLWDKPKPNEKKWREEASEFVKTLRGGGGTEMMKAINGALGEDHDPDKIRIVAFFTDGYVGNDMAILDAIKKNVGTARVFSFGIGSSVNRYLLDNMARYGRGEVEYALNPEEAEKAATRFYDRINAPVLTDISIDWGPLASVVQADEIYPELIPDLFSVKPVQIFGKYTPGEKDLVGEITLKGKTVNGPYARKIKLTLPAKDASDPVIAPMWARAKVDKIMGTNLRQIQRGVPDPKVKQEIVELGMAYNLLTRFTSFVAVEEKTVTVGGKARRVDVPVEMPEGVSYEGVFGGVGGGRGIGLRRRGYSGMMLSAVKKPMQNTIFKESTNDDKPRESATEAPDGRPGKPKPDPDAWKAKLHEDVRFLAETPDKLLDEKGDYAKGNLVVSEGKAQLAVYLSEWNEKTLKALEDAGFKTDLESKGVKMVIGTIDVKKIEALAKLGAVRRIALPNFK